MKSRRKLLWAPGELKTYRNTFSMIVLSNFWETKTLTVNPIIRNNLLLPILQHNKPSQNLCTQSTLWTDFVKSETTLKKYLFYFNRMQWSFLISLNTKYCNSTKTAGGNKLSWTARGKKSTPTYYLCWPL